MTDEFIIYEGDWKDDKKHGKGLLRGTDGEYEGMFVMDEMEG